MFKKLNPKKYLIVLTIIILTIITIERGFSCFLTKETNSNSITSYDDGDYNYLTDVEKEFLDEFKNSSITLGVPKYGSFSNVAIVGYEKGVSFLYKELLEKHLGLDVILYYDEWEELIKKLFVGDIDLLTGVTPTDKRKQYIDFTASYAPDYGALVIPENYHNIKSLNELEGKNIYVRRKSHHEDIIESKKTDFNFTSVSVGEFDYDLIDDNSFIFTTDEVITDIIRKKKKGLKINTIYQETPIVVGISRENSILFQQIIKKSMKEVFHNQLTLYVKDLRWRLKKALLQINLTSEEKDYLKRKKTLNVKFREDFFPHTFFDENEEEYKGVEAEIVQQISSFIDLPLNVLNQPKGNRVNKKRNQKDEKEDFSIEFKTPNNEKQFIFTENTSTEDIVLAAEKDKLERFLVEIDRLEYKIGVIKNSIFHDIAKDYYDDKNIVPAEDVGHLIKLKEDDKINFILTDRGTLTYYQNYKLEGDLIIYNHFTSIPLALGIDISNASVQEVKDKLLLKRIFDKTINFCIDTESKYIRWLSFGVDIEDQIENKNKMLLFLYLITLMGCIKLYINNKTIKKQKDTLYDLLYYDQEVKCRNRNSYDRDIDLFISQGVKGSAITYSVEGIYDLSNIYKYEEIDTAFKRSVDNIKQVVSKKGLVYRMNKNEFIIILADVQKDEVETIGRQIYKKITTPNIIKKEDHKNIKLSLGIASSQNKDIDTVVKESQMAKYLARMEGKKNLVIADGSIYEKFNKESQLKGEVIKALNRREYTPYFQLKKNLTENNICGCEALARWVDKSGKITSPGVFIPLLEELELIDILDLLILEKSMIQLREWIDKKMITKDFKLSFNLSIYTLEKEGILKDIEYFMNKYKITANYLEIEVTETIFIKSHKNIQTVLKGIKKLGITLSIDDFSAGHSSANYIVDFKFDIVKLDMSLLPTSEDDISKVKVYKAFVDMITELGIKSVCEGVENPFQEQLIVSLGVDIAQGYYYYKPKSAKEIEVLLTKNI